MAQLHDINGDQTLEEAWPLIEANGQAINAEVVAHKNTDSIAHDGDKIGFNNNGTGISANNVSSAIKEHVLSSNAHDSNKISNLSKIPGSKLSDALNYLKSIQDNLGTLPGTEHDPLVSAALVDYENEDFGPAGLGTGINGRLTKWENLIKKHFSYFISVKDFGAVGDGVTDDTAAIQAAIDYVYSNHLNSVFNADWNQKGGVVYFPAGTYKCGTIYLKEGVHLLGESADSVRFNISGTIEQTYGITNKYKDSIDGYRNVGIENISIVGGDIYLLKAYNSNIKNVSVYNATNGILTQLSTFLKIENFRAFNCSNAFSIVANAGAGPCTSVYARNIWIAHCGIGILLNGSTNWIDTVTFENIIVEYCTSNPIIVYGGSKDNHGISFRNAHMEQNSNYVIIQDSSVILDNFYFDDTTSTNIALLNPNHTYPTSVEFKDCTADIYVQPNVNSKIYYRNVSEINDNGVAKYISPDKENVYISASGAEILKNAYKFFKRKDIAIGEKAVFDLIVMSNEGYWIGKAYFVNGSTTTLIPDGNSVVTLTQNAAGTIATTAGGTNAKFIIKLIA